MDDPALKTHVIRLSANIGRQKGLWSEEQIQAALPPWEALPGGLEIDLAYLEVSDDEPATWKLLASEIRRKVSGFLQQVAQSSVRRISVFGLAPIPLLMVLGEALGEKQEIRVFNRFHRPAGWTWGDSRPDQSAFKVVTHTTRGLNVGVLLSISGKVHPEEAEAVLPPGPCAMYEIAVEEPGRDSVRTEAHLQDFASAWQNLLTKIRATHGPRCRIHLFPAVPVAVAVQCGLSFLPKADPPVRVYDHQRDKGGFVPTLDLLSPAPPQLRAGDAEPAKALVDFLARSFESADLRRLFAMTESLSSLVKEILWEAELAGVAHQVMDVLKRHGKVDANLFEALRRARPSRAAEIEEIAVLWGC
ncbi:SAVED domain-containing protein [Nannocystis bainbridge]|uniref:SAVED domain-containing protein n=1 Tax=Nannocystis bainbridge TaxID=2995303 RepID=A0ABT5E7M7_9BACT|nr:SAVED domain-containing protein [Nannocystis bainbridge]MDC0721329.1 SAVED domain-containing protein [Nannocystis bainbridge]